MSTAADERIMDKLVPARNAYRSNWFFTITETTSPINIKLQLNNARTIYWYKSPKDDIEVLIGTLEQQMWLDTRIKPRF